MHCQCNLHWGWLGQAGVVLVPALLWRRRKAGEGARAQRRGWETICGMTGLGWAGRLWEGWAVGAAGGLGRLRGAPLWTSYTTTLPWVWDVLFPKFSYVGHDRTSENISNRFNSCGFFSASPLLLGLCCVSFSGGSDSSFISWATKRSDCLAVMLLLVIPLLRLVPGSLVTIRRRCPSLPPPWDPLWLRLRHVAVWGDINCC